MKGDFTKLPFDPKKRNSRVYLQQGRVQLDSDFNELVDLLTHTRRQALVDVIGAHGAPADHAGFALSFTHQLRLNGEVDRIYWISWKEVTFQENKPFSIEMRIIPSEDSKKGGGLLSCMDEVGYYLYLENSYRVSFGYKSRDDQGHLETFSLQSFRSLRPSEVNHVAITYDGQQVALYLNGYLDVRQQAQLPPNTTGKGIQYFPVCLGALWHNREATDHYSGVMEEVRFWETTRSATEIATHVYHELEGNEEGLIGLVPLREGSGKKIKDVVSGREGIHSGEHANWEPDLRIGSGHYYVNGICCKNDVEISYNHQPDYPGSHLPQDASRPGLWLAYLDVWERMITPREDPTLAEVALNGIDTSVRTRIVQQVKLLAVSKTRKGVVWPEWQRLHDQEQHRGLMTAHRKTSSQILDNQLYRVEVHCGGGVYGPIGENRDKALAIQIDKVEGDRVTFSADNPPTLEAGQVVEFYSDLTDREDMPGKLMLVVEAQGLWARFAEPVGGHEDDKAHLRPIACLKWSTDNGALSWPVRSLETRANGDGVVQLLDSGRAAHRLGRDVWVELTHPECQLTGQSSQLVKLASVEETTRLIVKGPLPPNWDQLNRPGLTLVLWDQQGLEYKPQKDKRPEDADNQTGLLYNGLLPATQQYTLLEKGIEIRFSRRGQLRTGDYWLLPARTRLKQGIEWPTDKQNQPLPIPPHGNNHAYAPLALIESKGKGKGKIQDLRSLFTPLTIQQDTTATTKQKKQDPQPQPDPQPQQQTTIPIPDSGDAGGDSSMETGSIPTGYSLLGTSPVAPAGYHRTGLTLKAQPWSELVPPPEKAYGAVLEACVMHNRRFFAFYDSGEVWSYEPNSESWEACAWLPENRASFAAAALGDNIHILGGRDASGNRLDRHDIYHPDTDTWSEGPPMPTPRDRLAVASAMGVLFAMGGETRGRTVFKGLSAVNEIYDPADNTWKHGENLPSPRAGMTVASTEDRIHIFGGECRRLLWGANVATHECYFPESGEWQQLADLPDDTELLQAVGDKRGIHIFGGNAGSSSTRHLRYNYARNHFREMEPLPERPMARQAAGDDERIYLLDGNGGSMLHLYVRDSLLYVHRKD